MLWLSSKYIFYILYIFSIVLIVFEKFDDKVYDMKHCRALDGFSQTRSEKPNAPTIPTFITIF